MKKLFLFLTVSALTFSATSCTKDDDNAATGSMSTVKCTVDGTLKTFSQVVVQNYGDDLMVVAFNGASQSAATEEIAFVVQSNKVGNDAMGDLGFSYVVTGDSSWTDNTGSGAVNFTLNVTDNNTTAKTLKGTFSGTLKEYTGSKPSKAITNGTFDIKYQLSTPPSK